MSCQPFQRASLHQYNYQNVLILLSLYSFNNCPKCKYIIKQKTMKIKNLSKLFGRSLMKNGTKQLSQTQEHHYRPTPYLSHPFLQSVYSISQSLFPFQFKRERIFFQDGGHISLDWLPPTSNQQNPPILFIMHGLTGGSENNYIKELMKPASEQGYCCVCLNSRGFNNQMTSPIPFTGLKYAQLQTALQRITNYYPSSEIYLVGTSFGGNYLLRYLLRQKIRFNIKALVALATPINVTKVVQDMGTVYQKFFVKRYIEETVLKHPQMKFWEENGLVDMKKVKNSQNLMEFHTNLTAKIIGYPSAKEIFDEYSIADQQLKNLNIDTLMMMAKDDPIVSYKAMPMNSILDNKKIKLHTTEKGGHLCWFQGLRPKRWYPKPVLQYLKTLRTQYIL